MRTFKRPPEVLWRIWILMRGRSGLALIASRDAFLTGLALMRMDC